jgi:predicted alpha/beta hydrolase family esterase/diadenosine tetraphosphate (Ap4A) HIT family hydrolase
VLTIPGWQGSGPDHWQSQWERLDANITRVEQEEWNQPQLHAWKPRLVAACAGEPVVLAAHSLGTMLVAHAAGELKNVVGALLVAPPSLEVEAVRSFAPTPRARLPFPSILVASRTDPWMTFEQSQSLAADWGAEFIDAGALGHINADSQLGTWPFGRALLQRLLTKAPFTLDPRLRRDTHLVGESALSLLLSMNDARYPWLVLVPKRAGVTELHELSAADHATLTNESRLVATALTELFRPDKVNVAALGNVVRQLHVHHVSRRLGDAAWPGPVWGHSPRVARSENERDSLIARLRAHAGLAGCFGL